MTNYISRESFAFPAEIYSALSLLDADIQLSLYQSIMAYCITRTAPDTDSLKPVARAFWLLILPTLNRINDRTDRRATYRLRRQQQKNQSPETVVQPQDITNTIDLQNTTNTQPKAIPEPQPEHITLPATTSITSSPQSKIPRHNRHSNPSAKSSYNRVSTNYARPRVTLRDFHRTHRHTSLAFQPSSSA